MTGVKGLVDAGITKVPRIFTREKQNIEEQVMSSSEISNLSIPVIDFQGLENYDTPGQRKEVISSVNKACEKWEFFKIINHGIPVSVMEKMIEGVRQFHELDPELKKQYYSYDNTPGEVVYNSNHNLYHTPTADWKDSIYFNYTSNPPDHEKFPHVLRDIAIEYIDHAKKLGNTVFEVLSEALGLDRNQLIDMGCAKRFTIIGHYYPACPEPELTLGIKSHSDKHFLAIVLQDQVGGLQVLHQNRRVDVTPEPGSLVINIGYLLQLISNDKYVSVRHRVVAKKVGPRISVGSFFSADLLPSDHKQLHIGPIKELLTEENPPKYRPVTMQEYTESYQSKWIDGTSPLLQFKI